MKTIFCGLVSLMIIAVLFGKSEAFAPLVSALDAADKWLMVLLNHNGGHAADAFYWAISRNTAWVALGAVFLVSVSGKGARDFCVIVLCLALTITLADQVASSFFKPYFSRLRPSHCDEISGLLHYVGGYHGSQYGFVSSHAANAFGIATYISLLFKNKKTTHLMLIWACCVSYSRIYLGVHYMGDVLGGAVVGISCGILSYGILQYLRTLPYIKKTAIARPCAISAEFPKMLAMTVILSTAAIFCYSWAMTLPQMLQFSLLSYLY